MNAYSRSYKQKKVQSRLPFFLLFLVIVSVLAFARFGNEIKIPSVLGTVTRNELPETSRLANVTPTPTTIPTPSTFPLHNGDETFLKLKVINQEAEFACNVTAAAIVLQYRGVNVKPMEIYDALPKQTIKKENGFWGNPNLGYVGNIYGEYGGDKSDGYGVHWDPINQYISKFRKSEVKHDWNLADLLKEVDRDNPVILWWQNGYVSADILSWKTYDANGNVVEFNGVEGMHSAIVVGYKGDINDPQQIIVDDPWADRWDNHYAYYDIQRFKDLWRFYGNTAIVVY